MNTIKINKKDTKMIAHRGLSGIEQENTVCAQNENQSKSSYRYGYYYYKGYYGSRKYLDEGNNDWYSLTFTAFCWWWK